MKQNTVKDHFKAMGQARNGKIKLYVRDKALVPIKGKTALIMSKVNLLVVGQVKADPIALFKVRTNPLATDKGKVNFQPMVKGRASCKAYIKDQVKTHSKAHALDQFNKSAMDMGKFRREPIWG